MELASVTRLFKDQSTQKSTLLLEAVRTRERFKITIPSHKAGILALEGHGLNDRCGIYGVLSECVERLGGAFASVIVSLDKTRGVSAAICMSRDEELIRINADVVELVAFALHVQIPLFLDVVDESDEGGGSVSREIPEAVSSNLPAIFENVLSEIMGSKEGPSSAKDGAADADHELPLDSFGH